MFRVYLHVRKMTRIIEDPKVNRRAGAIYTSLMVSHHDFSESLIRTTSGYVCHSLWSSNSGFELLAFFCGRRVLLDR